MGIDGRVEDTGLPADRPRKRANEGLSLTDAAKLYNIDKHVILGDLSTIHQKDIGHPLAGIIGVVGSLVAPFKQMAHKKPPSESQEL